MKTTRNAMLLVVALGVTCRPSPPELRFPGAPVILISVDTLRADHLPAYGYGAVETPSLDRFRRDATLFLSACASAPMTLPSHVTMLTGLLPPQHGVRDNVGFRFDARAQPTLPSLLHSAGYATGAAVSSYVLRGETGLAEAFDFYEDSIDPRPGGLFREFQRSGSVTASLAERWIDSQKDHPFFLFFHIYEPHVPYDPPEPLRSRYASRPYDGEIAASDAIVGGLIEHLKKAGIYDRAIIIFTSDHGEGLGDHGEEQHSVLVYREVVHVPLMIKLPGNARHGGEVREPVSLADLLPTVTALVGIVTPKTSGLMLFDPLPKDRSVYSESVYARLHFGWSELRSVTDARTQFIDSPRPELYDIVSDPRESRDLAPRKRREVAAARQRLAHFPSAPPTANAAVSAEEKARLEALGYLGSSAASAPSDVNPVDRIADLEALAESARRARSGDVSGAIAQLQALVAKNPSMIEAWTQMGDIQSRRGDFPAAINAYRSALSHSPRSSSDILIALADAYLQAGDLDHAGEAARAAADGSSHAANILLARVALARKDFATASRIVLSLPRPRVSDLVLAAEIEQRRGHLDAALSLLDRAETQARERGQSAVFRLEFLRGDICARQLRSEDAIRSFEKEIAAFPGELTAWSSLALVKFVSGDRRGADEVLARMVQVNPGPAAQRIAAQTRKAVAE